MGFKSLIGLVWEDTTPKPVTPTEPQQVVPQPIVPQPGNIVDIPLPTQQPPAQDKVDKILSNFDTEAEKFNLVNAYYKAEANFASKNMDDITRMDIIMTTLQMLDTTFTKAKLAEQFNQYFKHIENEKAIFDKDIQEHERKEYGIPQREILMLQDTIKQYKNQIDELNASILKTENEIIAKKSNIDKTLSDITATKNSFNVALTTRLESIKSTINKLI